MSSRVKIKQVENLQNILDGLEPGGTSGQVQYNNDGSLDGANGLYYDDVNDRVGIGTTTPDYGLTINKSQEKQFKIVDSDVNAKILEVNMEASGPGGYIKLGDIDQETYGEVFTIDHDNGFFLFENGNVGIGTTSPSGILDVSGDASNSSILKITGDPNNFNDIIQLGDVDDVGKSHIFTIDGSDPKFTFIGANVGIGTTNPNEKLDIQGNVKIQNSLLSNQQNTDVDTGTETIATISATDYDAILVDFVVKNGTNLRAGTLYAVHDGTNVEFTETSTQDLGDTTDVELFVELVSGDLTLKAESQSDNWIVKSLIRAL